MVLASLQRFSPAALAYSRELLDDHWSEAAWLYARRERLRLQRGMHSLDFWEDLEGRASAHVDALCAAAELAVLGCEDRATATVGELHAVVRLLARLGLQERVAALLRSVDWAAPRRAEAVVDALVWEAPSTWSDPLATLLDDEALHGAALDALARVALRRGWAWGEYVLRAASRLEDPGPALIAGLGRCRPAEALPRLHALLEYGREPEARCAAALAALRLGDDRVLDYLAGLLETEDWPAYPLALCGRAGVWPRLRTVLMNRPSFDTVLAAGMLGHTDAIPLLLEALELPELSLVAAQALVLITGAPLRERVHVDVDAPMSILGVTRIVEDDEAMLAQLPSQSREFWSEWIQAWRSTLEVDGRAQLRFGHPYEPARALAHVADVDVPIRLREWMLDELELRGHLAEPRSPSPHLLVSALRAALPGLAAPARSHAVRGVDDM